jgi:hypothetical protein
MLDNSAVPDNIGLSYSRNAIGRFSARFRQNSSLGANDRLWPGAAVAHTRRNRTLEKSEILRLTACMVVLVLSAFFCNSEEAGVEGPLTASAFLAERQTPKEFPHPHHPASMRNLAATTADLTAS